MGGTKTSALLRYRRANSLAKIYSHDLDPVSSPFALGSHFSTELGGLLLGQSWTIESREPLCAVCG
jgi:hypothetical protein